MNFEIQYTDVFEKELKILSKKYRSLKYRSLKDDLLKLIESLEGDLF